MSAKEGLYEEAVRRFFETHAEDPRKVERRGRPVPWSVVYHERMMAWLERIAPEANETLRLAVSCQHLRRWKIPRQSYPAGKAGYKKWRHELAGYHGDEAAAILEEVGYGKQTIERVRELLLKKGLKDDADVQVLEDVACLVFLENELAAFAARHEDEKITTILRKTWNKMSERGRDEARKLVAGLPEDLRSLVVRSIGL